jgi:hypothetical protein
MGHEDSGSVLLSRTRMTQTRFSPELWAAVLERISNGESLRQVSRTDGFPPEATIRNWIRSDQELATQYAQARALQIESRADEVRDEAFRDDLEPNDRRVRIDALKWLLSKLKPERYGLDRLLVLGDESSPVHHLQKSVSVADLIDRQLEALQTFCQRMLEAKQN